MDVAFERASAFVPAGLDAWRWASLGPLYDELAARPVRTAAELERLILDRSELDAAASEAFTNLSIRMTCHTDDERATADYLGFVEHVQPRLREAGFALDRKTVASPAAQDLPAARYAVYLRDLENNAALFRPENVELETTLARLEQKYQEICGAQTAVFLGRERTLAQLAQFNEEPDRALREGAWRAAASRRLADADALDELFEAMLPLRQRIARNAGFDNYRDYMFRVRRRFDYGPDDCHAYARGVELHVTPVLRRIAAGRRGAMGLSTTRPWDTQADPLGRPALRPFRSGAELVDGVSRVCHGVDARLGRLFDTLRDDPHGPGRDGRFLDLESRKGKAPGGYQASRDAERTPFIFMNAVGTQRDVETLLHEAGHAFHALLSRRDPLLHYRVEIPLEFAEVASMTMELLAYPHLGTFYAEPEAGRARRDHLEGRVLPLLAVIAAGDQFQHWIYTTPGHTRAERHAAWAELSARYGPDLDWSGLADEQRKGWHRILHIFTVPFYYIEYAIAQFGALGVWLRHRREPAAAMDRYLGALTLGGSAPLPALFGAAGVEFDFSPGRVATVVAGIEDELARLPG